MSEQTKIEWADKTFNPWIGCTKVSPGCANCYAENTTRARVLRSQGQETWGKGKQRSRTSAATWKNPVKWNREHEALLRDDVVEHFKIEVERARVFPSLCDWLDDEVPIEWLADFLKLIHDTPNLDWLLLTKRPQNFKARLYAAWKHLYEVGHLDRALIADRWLGLIGGPLPPANVRIGTSVENQKAADERIPEVLKIPAKVHFLSVEPLLGHVSLTNLGHGYEHTDCLRGIHRQFNSDGQCREAATLKVDWVIVGGESGPKARPCNVEWIRSIVAQCKAAAVPCFVKQLGSKPCCKCSVSVGTYSANCCEHFPFPIRHPKGGDMAEWSENLRVREFPKL